jgi:hypothetical protein
MSSLLVAGDAIVIGVALATVCCGGGGHVVVIVVILLGGDGFVVAAVVAAMLILWRVGRVGLLQRRRTCCYCGGG